MGKAIHFLTIIFLILILQTVYTDSLSRQSISKIKSAVVYIEIKKKVPLFPQDFTCSGTGFFVTPYGHIITAYHVVQPTLPFEEITFPAFITGLKIIINSGSKKQKTVKASLFYLDRKHDIALLATEEKDAPFLKLDEQQELFETQPVWVFGYPFGEEFSIIHRGPEISINQGNITALRHDDKGILQAVQFDAAVNPGNSGGPVVDSEGEVTGIVTSAYGKSQLNFATPLHCITSLMENINPEKDIFGTCHASLVTYPAGAAIYIDNEFKGVSPLHNVKLEKGHHMLMAVKKGYTTWIEETTFLSNRKVEIGLTHEQNTHIIVAKDSRKKTNTTGCLKAFKTGGLLLSETFEIAGDFETWEQTTGGDEKRTWYVDEGALHQYESNEFLHTISLGNLFWNNYSMNADMRITDEHDDSRAGLIFRETEDGFYLFRIHKETDRAQLAYHSKNPFGWFILEEKKLDMDIKDKWYNMTVQGLGNHLLCFLGDTCIFSLSNDLTHNGRIGFYSVESKASFDNLFVYEIKNEDNKLNTKKELSGEIQSFWFTDFFNLKSTWWYPYNRDNSIETSWSFTEGGCIQVSDDNTERAIEFNRYMMKDFTMDLMVTLAEGGDDACFEMMFKKKGSTYYALRFIKKEKKVEVITVKDGKVIVLKDTKMYKKLFESVVRIILTVKNNTLTCQWYDTPILTFTHNALSKGMGKFGFSTKNVSCILHKVTISSVHE